MNQLRSFRRATPVVVVAVLVALVCCVVLLSGQATCEDNDELKPAGQEERALAPALFDFANYQQLFSKHYKSRLESVTRRVYFLANAFKVYAAGVAYKLWRSSSYLAVNEFADKSKQELDRMLNKMISGNLTRSDSRVETRTPQMEEPLPELERNEAPMNGGGPEEIARALELEIMERLHDPSLANLIDAGHSRRKRETAMEAHDHRLAKRPPRSLTLDQLISGRQKGDSPQVNQKRINRNPRGNNLNYDPLAMEPMTEGLRDQQEEIEVWRMNPTEAQERQSAATRARNMLGADKWRNNPFVPQLDSSNDLIMGEAPGSLSLVEPDGMFADLRNTGCLFEVRHQGTCGCCYAFAAISMMEYLYCRKTNQLVPFSEQYLVDCGNKRVAGMEGCAGAGGWSVPTFIHNFGLELASHYPYLMRESQCPYSDDTDLRRTGFIRMDLRSVTRIPVPLWEEQLKVAPMYVAIATSADFYLYGGGVYDGRGCAPEANHAMVVIGHGREDGHEFWLIRNSHGPQWGDRGHYKLSKSAPERCIQFQEGFAFGLGASNEYVSPKINQHNPAVISMTNAAQARQRAESVQRRQQQADQSYRARMLRHQQQHARKQ